MKSKHPTPLTKCLGVCALLAAAAAIPAHAATTVIDFNSDPDLTGLYSRFGNVFDTSGIDANWRPKGGFTGGANDGYLAVTDAKSSSSSTLVFKDLENGLIIKSFTFECDLRIGGGTEPPADGFSINFASANDPVVEQADAGTNPNTFAGTDPEASLPEEGTRTGLAVGFDLWQSGVGGGDVWQDVVGVSVRVDGQLIAQLPIPLTAGNVYLPSQPRPGNQGSAYTYVNEGTYRNLATNDANYARSMQTGARNLTDTIDVEGTPQPVASQPQPPYGDPNHDLWVKHLVWEHFKMEVDDSGKVKVFWKGNELTPPGGLATSFQPRAGRIVFAGRTGGSWAAHHVDNIKLVTQPFTSAALSAFSGNGGGFTFQVTDQVNASLDPATVAVKLNGTPVTTTVDKVGMVSYIHYTAPAATPFAVGSSNYVELTFRDNFGVATSATRSFTVGNYTGVPSRFALTSAVGSTPGFSVRTKQMAVGRSPGDANFTWNAERHWANAFIDPTTGNPYANLVVGGEGPRTVDYINFAQDGVRAGAADDAGQFRTTNTAPYDVADIDIPGITAGPDQGEPTLPGYNNNIVTESIAYLSLKQGFYTFGVQSDDGFLVTLGGVTGTVLGEHSGGRSGETLFDVYIPTDGLYPVRLLYWEGGGGADCEFYYVDQTTGVKRLVNDLRDPVKQIAAFASSSISLPTVTKVLPTKGDPFVFADANITVELTDGTIPVEAGSVKLTLNGTDLGGGTKAGAVTTIARAGSLANLLPAGQNNLSLVYSYTQSGNAVSVTNTWSFSVVPYTWIPAANKVPSSAVSGYGFLARVNQIDRSGNANQGDGTRLPNVGDANRMPRPEMQLALGNINVTNGLPYTNVADLNYANSEGVFETSQMINYNGGFGGNSGIVGGDTGFPGLPGFGTSLENNVAGLHNYVAEFTGYIELKAGVYLMAFNSDDGFVVSSSPNPRDTLGTVLGYANVGRGNTGTLPNPGGPSSFVPTPGTAQNNFTFGVVVPEDGIYPFRILYWQGGGGVNGEFLVIDKRSGRTVMVGDQNGIQNINVFATYSGQARPWVKFSVSPTPWDNRIMQAGPGPILAYGRTANSWAAGDIVNSSDSARPWADVGIGGVLANVGSEPVGLLLNGVPVPATITTTGGDTLVSYKPNPPLPPGSTNVASLYYGGVTNSWRWISQTWSNVPTDMALPLSAADTSAAGFKVKVFQATTGRPNTTAGAEEQIAGTVPSVALPGPNADGSYTYPGIINWNNNFNTGGNNVGIGNFQDNVYGSGWPYGDRPDEPIPGVPGTGRSNADNSTAEIFAYLKFDRAGYYRFGVNSDDGFALKVGTPGQANGYVVYRLDGGKGASDVPFSFYITEPGLYPMRLIWFNGGGGAQVEFFSYDDNGNKIPINDPTNANAIKAYYAVTGVARPQITGATISGGNVTVIWINGGTLETAPSVNGPWNSTGNSTGTFTEAVAAGSKFFRVAQ